MPAFAICDLASASIFISCDVVSVIVVPAGIVVVVAVELIVVVYVCGGERWRLLCVCVC